MKRIACYIFLLIIIAAISGCAETSAVVQEIDTDSTAISEETALSEADINDAVVDTTTTPEVTPTLDTPTVSTTPEFVEPTARVFNIDDVEMRSTSGSSCFSEVGYDSDWEILVVKFRDSGSVYTYADFPIDEWNKFISASSLGSWYNKYIKGRYDYKRIS